MLENHDEDELFSQGDYERQNISQMLTNVDLWATSFQQVYLIMYNQGNLESMVGAFSHAGASVQQWACCWKRDRAGGCHYQIVVKLERMQRWSSIKKFLHQNHRVIVNFSNAHHNYYSSWKYVTKEDEEVVQSPNHPDL